LRAAGGADGADANVAPSPHNDVEGSDDFGEDEGGAAETGRSERSSDPTASALPRPASDERIRECNAQGLEIASAMLRARMGDDREEGSPPPDDATGRRAEGGGGGGGTR